MTSHKHNKKNKKNRRNVKKTLRKRVKWGGGELPDVIAEEPILPPLSLVKDIYNPLKDFQTIDITQSGGALSKDYVGPTWGQLSAAIFRITDDQIKSFKRITASGMDCVISAMQYIGILDTFAANLLRIISIGKTIGLSTSEIESIFSLRYGRRFKFESSTSITEFVSTLKRNLLPQHVMFCGVKYIGGSNHVFLIGRDISGNIVKIDPQSQPMYCYLESDVLCSNKFVENVEKYYLLFSYSGPMTEGEFSFMIQ